MLRKIISNAIYGVEKKKKKRALALICFNEFLYPLKKAGELPRIARIKTKIRPVSSCYAKIKLTRICTKK